MRFDRVAILDWSAAKGPKRGKDSIWLGVADASGTTSENIATRQLAALRLHDLARKALAQGERLLIGADFAFGFPIGFAQALTGTPHALAVWDWLSARITDTPENVTNYRDVAAEMNARFGGGTPFWGNGARQDVPGLPRLKPPLPPGLGAQRETDIIAREGGAWPKSVWQLAGAGAVGAQVLTGIPVLNALRHRLGAQACVWPFQAMDGADMPPVVLAEVYPSLIRPDLRRGSDVPDQAQVTALSTALFLHTARGPLQALMLPTTPARTLAEEGWIVGAGQSVLLNSVLDRGRGQIDLGPVMQHGGASSTRKGSLMNPALAQGGVAVITGGASGIGLSAARHLGALGLRICVADLGQDRLDAARDALLAAGVAQGDVMLVPTDVGAPDQITALADRVFADWGQVNVLMNNAGMQPGSSIFDAEGNWDRILQVNMLGVIRGAQTFAPRMIAGGQAGLIINTGSKQGITAPPGDPAYNVSKAGVKVFTEALQHALRNTADCRIGAHLFIPGFVYTPLTAAGRTERPAGAWTPEEAVAFLFASLARGDFYILCPDNEVDRATDEKRILWAAGDITENRPPLSRWHPDFAAPFKDWLKE